MYKISIKALRYFSTEKLNAICRALSCVVFHFIGKPLCINLILNILLTFTRLISQQGLSKKNKSTGIKKVIAALAFC